MIFLTLLALATASPDRLLRDYLTRIAMEQLAGRRQAVAAIRTPAEFETRRAEFKKSLLKMIGGLPTARTPLNLQRTGTLDRGDYRVDKIVFESQPRFFVTANLYIPKTGKPPYPAVIHPTGHSTSAKNRAFYQTLSIGLVKHGFVVMTYDPLGQGERRIFWDRELEDSKVGGTTVEHEMVGVQSLLAGESIARLMIWDGIRGIDVLSSLPEVDGKRIGVTGCSGGGTMTTYLAAVDDRLKAAAPACYISSWEDQLQADTGPQDAEQQFPDLLKNGYDHADFVEAFAPKPYLICSTDGDFFPLEGARKTYEEARRIYALLGAEEKMGWFHEPGGHGTPRDTRQAIYGWMKRWLAGGPEGPAAEAEFKTEHEEDLNATKTGQVATSLGGETASTINRKRYAAMVPKPAKDIRAEVLRLTRAVKPKGEARLRRLEEKTADGFTLQRVSLEVAPDRVLPATLAKPATARPATVLYLSDTPARSAFDSAGDARELVNLGYTVLALDLSGRGQTASTWRSYSQSWFGRTEKEAWLGLMVGRPLVGLHVEEILAALDAVGSDPLPGAGAVIAVAKGLNAVDLLHAAALDSRIGMAVLESVPVSYRAMATAPVHKQLLDIVVPGVYGRYDLPALAASLGSRKVVVLGAASPTGRVLPLTDVKAAWSSANVRAGSRRESERLPDACPELR